MKLFDCDLEAALREGASQRSISGQTVESKTEQGTILEPYQLVEWDEKEWRDDQGPILINYASHVNTLLASSYNRAPTCRELFSLIIADMEGTLEEDLKEVGDDIRECDGEYLNTAFGIVDNILYVYDDIRDVSRDVSGTFRVPDNTRWYKNLHTFNISDLADGGWYNIKDIADVQPILIEYLFSKKFDELPGILKEKKGGAAIRLPEDDKIYVLGRGTSGGEYDINLANNHDYASRGVRRK